jgi:hypothetical protein
MLQSITATSFAIPTDDATIAIVGGLLAVPIIELIKHVIGKKWDQFDFKICSAFVCVTIAIGLSWSNGTIDATNAGASALAALVVAHRLYDSIVQPLAKKFFPSVLAPKDGEITE